MLTVLALSCCLATAELPVEAPVLPGAQALSETGRFRSTRTYDETLEYYERVFKRTGGVRWHNVVNLPGVKAKNIESLRKKTNWEGINISEVRGEVRIYIIPREAPPATPSQSKAPAKSSTKTRTAGDRN